MINGVEQELRCQIDPSYDYNFHFIGTFYTKCLDTQGYYIKFSRLGSSAPNDNFKPTRFQPKAGKVLAGSLFSIPPVLENVAPENTTISVLVEDNRGCNRPLEGIPISLKNTIEPKSGSHKHFSDDSEIGTGKYVSSIPPWTASNEEQTHIASMTDNEGLLTANYQAGELGVQENVLVTVINTETDEQLTTSKTVDIKIPGLAPLEGGPYIVLGSYDPGCDEEHNLGPTKRLSNYLIPAALVNVENVANQYNAMFSRQLSFNDASLAYGGLFDNGTRAGKCHVSHRQGIDIDLNSTDADGKNVRGEVQGVNGKSQALLSIIKTMVEDNEGCQIKEKGNPPPIHFRFFSKQGCL